MKFKVNRKYHIPYIAGYNMSGSIIYIDSRLPKTLPGTSIKLEKYLLIHELTEQHLEDHMALSYPEAHAIAGAAELAAFDRDGHSKEQKSEYIKFYKQWEKLCRSTFDRIPADLDLSPYVESKDHELLKKMKQIEPAILVKG